MKNTVKKIEKAPLAFYHRELLALHGGAKVRTKKFPSYKTIGLEEEKAVLEVLRSGVLSRFLGTWHEDFYGGPHVQAFEAAWALHVGAKHAIAVNSATSALYAAVGACGIEPGDEVIVSPYTMTASAVAPLIYQALPVFADIESDYYCLSASSIEKKITPRTKAIIVVDLFGQSYDAHAINALAKKYGLMVIEDCAQAPGAFFENKPAGTLSDIGIYSLNYHKHIHTGEGGMLVTNNDLLADRLRLIRNHAEAVVEGKNIPNISNLIGFNYRMTEIEAAIGQEQLKKLPLLIEERQKNVMYLEKRLANIPCLTMPKIRKHATHVYYLHALQFNETIAGCSRDRFVQAVQAELMPIELRETEGIKVNSGYVRPLYLQPLFQQRIAYGSHGVPWSNFKHALKISYAQGSCPTVEDMHFKKVITHELMKPGMMETDLDDVCMAFEKVWRLRGSLT